MKPKDPVLITAAVLIGPIIFFAAVDWPGKTADTRSTKTATTLRTGSGKVRTQNDFVFWESISRHLLSITR